MLCVRARICFSSVRSLMQEMTLKKISTFLSNFTLALAAMNITKKKIRTNVGHCIFDVLIFSFVRRANVRLQRARDRGGICRSVDVADVVFHSTCKYDSHVREA